MIYSLKQVPVSPIFLPLLCGHADVLCVQVGFMPPKQNTTSEFGRKAAEARAQITPRLSQRELAKRLQVAGIDINRAGVAQIEAGKRTLNYYEVSVLAAVLNTTPFELRS